jgi:hypothetical protein
LNGAWTASSATLGYYGDDYIHDGNQGQGQKTVKFTPSLPADGNYAVSLMWTAHESRADNVTVEIVNDCGNGAPAEPLVLVSPNGARSFAIGDVMSIAWVATEEITGVLAEISVDNGRSWLPITQTSAWAPGSSPYEWTIPASLEGTSLVTDQALVRLSDYFETSIWDNSDAAFSITETGAAAGPRAPITDRNPVIVRRGMMVHINAPSGGAFTATLYRLDGSKARVWRARAQTAQPLELRGLSAGVYRLRVSAGGRVAESGIVICR